VLVTNGVRSCEATLSGTAGVASGSCSLQVTEVGTNALTASYAFSPTFGASATLAPASLSVRRAPSDVAISLSRGEADLGDEQATTASVSVHGAFPGVEPSGSVVVVSAGRVLCTATLRSARATCQLPPRDLAVGVHALAAHFDGSSELLASSTTRTATLTVVRAAPGKVRVAVSALLRQGAEPRPHLVARTTTLHGTTDPSGAWEPSSPALPRLGGRCVLQRTQLACGAQVSAARASGSTGAARPRRVGVRRSVP